MAQRTLSGRFTVITPSGGVWRLDGRDAPGLRLYVRGLRGGDGAVPAECGMVAIEWTAAGPVHLALRTNGATVELIGESAFLHEPQPRLYESVPLAHFDGAARRFWRRVFTIARIPGGRFLLSLLAARPRGR